ncbi:MAG TPA: TerC family protein [Tepidisphaeraceae bacterium]|jgi:predicted tellurium resistance membrane protein TerC|nr:TerC family protein [Tepidisphaeraceae bacterium]
MLLELAAASMPFLSAATEGAQPIANLFSMQAAIALITLTLLEIVLGIDNIIFISVLADKLPLEQQGKARKIGLSLAMIMRVILLLCISWIMGLTTPVPIIGDWFGWALGDKEQLNWRDMILLLGGLFLIYKSVTEIHDKLEGEEHGAGGGKNQISFASVITQILILDIVFSLDSVITAVGMVQTTPETRTVGLTIMITAVVIAVGVMLFAAKPISEFVNRHPTVKMLAFSFLILVGVVLIVDASHRHIPKGYIYFAMAFSIGVEMLNLKLRGKSKKPVQLHQTYVADASTGPAGH